MPDRQEPRHSPAAYDFDKEWDVEKALLEKRLAEPPEQPEPPRRLPEQPRHLHRARHRPKRRKNVRGWLVLTALALVVLLTVAGLVLLVRAIIKPKAAPIADPTGQTAVLRVGADAHIGPCRHHRFCCAAE